MTCPEHEHWAVVLGVVIACVGIFATGWWSRVLVEEIRKPAPDPLEWPEMKDPP